jgi:hypothetical protein
MTGTEDAPRDVGTASARHRNLQQTRTQLVARMLRAAERQVADIETRLADSGQAPDCERHARTLALLARTMQSLAALDARRRQKTVPSPAKSHRNEPLPRSIDELRRSLARKLEAIIAERDSGAAGRE